MLIQTQNKNMLVNSDNLAYIHVDRVVSVIATFATPGLASIILGTYDSADDCREVISSIMRVYKWEGENTYEMPQRDEVKS